ncbi:MAG: hypothetical protein AB7O96_16315 [Pseudobdellovibrionaceae bacterium]
MSFKPLLIALILHSYGPVFGAISSEKFHKSFAAFVAAYNPITKEARGGVAGTAFFISPTEAITAYHVIRPSTFARTSKQEQIFVWLVHEGEKAIELLSQNVTYFPDKDLTRVRISQAKAVAKKFVFKNSPSQVSLINRVHTEGFLANSVGPTFTLLGNRLTITGVPSLIRIRSEGFLIRKARVDLKAPDVVLNGADCFMLSYQPTVGLSGGPVILGDSVIGMNSFADTVTRNQTWAVDLHANSVL